MNSLIFKSINRRIYFIGLIIIFVINSGVTFIVESGTTTQTFSSKLIVVTIFFGLVKLIWDYKRIKDISTNKYFLLLLLIPIILYAVSTTVSTSNPSDLMTLVSESNPQLLMVMVFSLINMVYKLFLIIKKGSNETNMGYTPIY